jgi:DNA-binding NarL/FixJ family response regulator
MRDGLLTLLFIATGATGAGWRSERFLLEEAGDHEELLARLGDAPADVVLIDSGWADMPLLEAVRLLARSWPGAPVVVLVAPDERDLALDALRAGASDCVFKLPHELVRLEFWLEAAVIRAQHLVKR